MPVMVLASMGCFVLNLSAHASPGHLFGGEGAVPLERRGSDFVAPTVPFFLLLLVVFLEDGMPVVWQKKKD